MTPELLTMIVDALRHETLGVNAQLQAVTGLAGHPAPPAVERVYSSVEDDEVVLDQPLGTWPALVVEDLSPVTLAGEVSQGEREGDVLVGIGYVTGDTGNAARAFVHAGQSLHAAHRAIADALLADDRIDDATRNGVQLETCSAATLELVREKTGMGMISGGLYQRFRLRDVAPTRDQLLALEA